MIAVEHFANIDTHLAIEMVGRSYRVVRQRVVNGSVEDVQPVDGEVFDSIDAARKHRAALTEKPRG